MRNWQLTADDPLCMRFAADARLCTTSYIDDQSWEIVFGTAQEPAFSIQTRYGGRAGLARLVPMLVLQGRKPLYDSDDYAGRPILTAFAPNYARIQTQPTSDLGLDLDLWVMESQALGGRFILTNKRNEPVSLRLDLFGQVVREGRTINMNLLGLDNGLEALHLGKVGGLNPVLMMDYAAPVTALPGEPVSPKLIAPVTIPVNGSIAIRWVHAGLPVLTDSLQSAYHWLYKTDWDQELKRIEQINEAVPAIETGNKEWDAALAFGINTTLRSVISPTKALPYPSLVSARIPSRGFSPSPDGSDHGRQWNGQTVPMCHMAAPGLASISPELGQGILRNFIAVQQPDGWIDAKPGAGGQRSNVLAMPLLISTALNVSELTDDKVFLAEVADELSKFYQRWFKPDMDRDNDGCQEWTNTAQMGYIQHPIFGYTPRNVQHADIKKVEAPDLLAFLTYEFVNSKAAKIQLPEPANIDQLWNDAANTYLYRDRDTHLSPSGTTIYRGKGDDVFDAGATLRPANRLIMVIIGGKDHAPHVSAVIEGTDFNGNGVVEHLDTEAFTWGYGMGAAVTDHAYSQIKYIKFEGLSRVYSVEINTVDLTRQTIMLLAPILVTSKENAAQLVRQITDENQYWRPYGLPISPANDPAFTSNNGVFLFWNALILEGLLKQGYLDEAMTLFTRLMTAQVQSLKQYRGFREAYNCDTGEGIGDIDELTGIMPLHVVLQLIGVRVINKRRVWAGGSFAFPNAIKVTQHGVEVTRSAAGTTIRFPSGHVAEVDQNPQFIDDPTPEPAAEPAQETPPVEIASPVADKAPEAASVIPVDTKKDDTLEIPIHHVEEGSPESGDSPAEDGPGVTKIPVKSE